ncbi:hypothetical protein TSMEX_007862 [Taenia solium]|eukprot:TsM_000318600 transcript=TsM_000318600 gene=TsM_000318600
MHTHTRIRLIIFFCLSKRQVHQSTHNEPTYITSLQFDGESRNTLRVHYVQLEVGCVIYVCLCAQTDCDSSKDAAFIIL